MAQPVRRTLVVARHTEDIGWLDRIPAGWRPLVVQKGEDLPNEGREAASYLHAMAELRPTARVRDIYGFVQGDPFAHCGDLLDRLQQPVKGFTWWGDPHTSSGDGSPHHPGLAVARCHAEWGCGEFKGEVVFAAGAQFAITGRQLRRRTPGWYRDLHDAVLATPEGPWVIERLWERLLT